MRKDFEFLKQLRMLYAMGVIRGELRTQELFLRNAFELMTRKIPAHADRYLWYSLFAPSEIIHAAEAVAIECDFMSAYLGAFGHANKLIDFAERELGMVHICAYHKTLIGALHQKVLPAPRAMVVCGNCCDSVRKLGTYVGETFGTQVFVVDAPIQRTAASRAYLERQLVEMTRFVADVTGVPFSFDRLRDAVRRSNEAASYWQRALDLRQGPPLLEGIGAMRQLLNIHTTFGTSQAVDITKAFYEDLLQLRESRAELAEDKCRLMWYHNLPAYRSFFDRLENDIGASVVVEMMAYPHQPHLDEEDIFGSIADRLLTHPVVAVREHKGDYYRQIAERFRVDGAIQLMHLNCRGNYGISRCASDAMQDTDIPMLLLEMDGLDNRQFSEEQMRTRVQAFVEAIRGRKAARRSGAPVALEA